MLSGVQGLNMSLQYGNTQCPLPSKKCQQNKKCFKKYYKKCKPQWMPSNNVLGSIG